MVFLGPNVWNPNRSDFRQLGPKSPECLESKLISLDYRWLGPLHNGVLSKSPDCPKSELTENGTCFSSDFGIVRILDVICSGIHCIIKNRPFFDYIIEQIKYVWTCLSQSSITFDVGFQHTFNHSTARGAQKVVKEWNKDSRVLYWK